MSALLRHLAFEFRSGIRNRTLLLLNYLFPVGFYALMGLLMTQINPMFQEAIVPSMAVFAALAATMLGLPDPLVAAREAGIFRTYKINGVPAAAIVIIPAVTASLHATLVAAVIAITAPALFGGSSPSNWWAFAATFAATVLACGGLAVLIGVVSSSTRVTVLWSQLVFIPSMILGGMTGMPPELLPESLGRLARLLPPTHAMQAFAGWAMQATMSPTARLSLAILVAGGLLSFGLAIYLFDWDRHNDTRRGHPLMGLLALLPYAIGVLWQI